jgi:hypothetical protein
MTPHTRQEMCPRCGSDDPALTHVFGARVPEAGTCGDPWHTLPSQAPAPQNNTLVCDDCGHEGCD